jgi:hypothetical protein
MAHGIFGTAINCMDGRVQLPVTIWMKEQFHLNYVDMITEPGPDKLVSAGQGKEIESIKARATISANAHGSKIIVIAGHDDCAGNPVAKDQHLSQIRQSIQVVRSWNLPFEKVIGIWVNKDWKVEVVASSSK